MDFLRHPPGIRRPAVAPDQAQHADMQWLAARAGQGVAMPLDRPSGGDFTSAPVASLANHSAGS